MRLRAAAIYAALLLAAMSGSAASFATSSELVTGPICHDEALASIIEGLEEADKYLPNVPSDEAAYLLGEARRALKISAEEAGDYEQSNKVYAALVARPLYYAWTARSSLARAKSKITYILVDPNLSPTYKGNAEAEKLERALSAMSALDGYVRAMTTLIDRQEQGRINVFPTDELQRTFSRTVRLNGHLSDYMKCKLAKVMGPQS
jgi:hypothetical protein